MTYPPTKRQRQLEITLEALTVDGVSPSYEELGEQMGLSHGAVRSLAVGLCKRGRLRRVPGAPRSLQLVKQPEHA